MASLSTRPGFINLKATVCLKFGALAVV
jgi:hypothetical protein